MNWRPRSSTIVPATRGGLATETEYMELVNDAGDVVASFSEDEDGTVSMSVDGQPSIQTAVLTADFPKTNDTLTAVTGWSDTITLEAGKTYLIRGYFICDDAATGQAQLDLAGGTVTATGITGDYTACVDGVFGQTTFDALNDQWNFFSGAGFTGIVTQLSAVIEVNAGGTLIPRFAQLITDAGASTLLKYSTLTATEISPTPSY